MNPFFRNFFASLLALVVFNLLGFFILFAVIGALASSEKPSVPQKSVLVLDLSQHFNERIQENLLRIISGEEAEVPGLYDVLRLIRYARDDKNIAGIYILANGNNNGFAASEELRRALLQFKTSKKFVLAYGEMMTQKAYYVAQVADRIYANPTGVVEWNGFSANLLFLKGTLERLKIQPQIFYAGKFKSATEPLRTDKMTPENKLQTMEWIGDLYHHFLVNTAAVRKKDTATLHQLANTGAIQTSQDAVQAGLIDAAKYDDEVRDEIKRKLGKGKYDKFSLVSISRYAESADFKQSGSGRIALIYAEGDIVDGEGSRDNIGGERFRKIIRRARLEKAIKAIVVRINSGGGSAMASDVMWRELAEAKRDKPVVVSFGDVAASGGYYMGCGADSIFALPNTITGSIGVFGIIPNM
ncbi:MAG: signal peptide peptidase SppA, partial [Flavisolibacter sp.]|nr:signal peptide peptidase SppA [Flavisolibacter sp.]